jgi:hypothetical protein
MQRRHNHWFDDDDDDEDAEGTEEKMRWDYNRSFESKKTCIKKSWWYYLFLAQEPFSSNILPTDEAGRGRRVVPFLSFFRVKNSPVLEFASTRFCCEDWKNCSAKFEKAIQQQQERKNFLHHNTAQIFLCCTLDLEIHERSGISVVDFEAQNGSPHRAQKARASEMRRNGGKERNDDDDARQLSFTQGTVLSPWTG